MPDLIRHPCFDSALRATLSTNGRTFALSAHCMFLGHLHMLTGFGLNIAEFLKTEIADNDSDNTEKSQEYGRRGEPPISKLYTVV